MKNELVIRLNAMGDILLAIPAVRALTNTGSKVHWLINKRWQELAPLLPAKVHLYRGSDNLLKTVKELKAFNFSKVHDLQGKIASIIIRSLLNKPLTKYKKRSLQEQINAIRGLYPLRVNERKSVWQNYATSMGLDIKNPNADLELSTAYMSECCDLLYKFNLKAQSFFVLHPSASKSGKEMPEELVSKLVKEANCPVALIGTSNKCYKDINFIDLRNKISLYHLAGLMKLSSGVISTDSGPMHLARAVNSRIVAIFFQTCPSLGFAPIPSDRLMLISKPLPCKPCSLHGQRAVCPENNFDCKSMNWNRVTENIFRFMEQKS